MGSTQMVNIDWSKIDTVIKSHHLKQGDVGMSMGHDPSYLTNIKNTQRMRKSDALLFNKLYGVDIMKEMVSADEINEKRCNGSIDYDKLSKAVSKVIDYDRLEDIMLSIIDYDRLSEAVCGAMVRALEGDSQPKERERRKLE